LRCNTAHVKGSAVPLVEVQLSDVGPVEDECIQHMHRIDSPLRFALTIQNIR